MPDDRDEDDLTPAHSPQAKRNSSRSLEAPKACPRCKGKPIPCGVCLREDGTNARYTDSAFVMAGWELAAAKCDTDPEELTPPTERNDR